MKKQSGKNPYCITQKIHKFKDNDIFSYKIAQDWNLINIT